jgi:O-antigen ligase
MWAVLLLIIVVLALRGLVQPWFGLLALLTVYVVQPGELYPVLGKLHLERVLIVLVLISFFAHGYKLRFPPQTRSFLMFFGAMVLAIPLAYWPGNSAAACVAYFEVVLLHLLIVSLLTDETRVSQLVALMVALTGWLAMTSLILYFNGVREVHMNVERATGLTSSGGDANTLGISLVIAMPLDFLLMRKENPWRIRLLGFAVFAGSALTVLITGSRTSAMSMVVVLMMLIFQNKRNLRFIPLLLIALPIAWVALPQQYKARYQTVENLKNDDSYQNRVLSWEGGIQMFLHNPLTGVGPENYTIANGMEFWPVAGPKHWLNAHSLYFKVLGELGSVGVITFCVYVFGTIGRNRRLMRELPDFATSAVVLHLPAYCNVCFFALLFTGYSAHNLYRPTWAILGAISGSLTLLPRLSLSLAKTTALPQKRKPAWMVEDVEENNNTLVISR